MADISNKTLAILVSLAIVISLAGIVFSPKATQKITGMATNYTAGTAQLNVTCYTALNLYNKSMDFGLGFVAQGAVNCTMSSNETAGTWTGCGGFTQPGNNSFALVNEGITNMTLDVNSSYYDLETGYAAAAFLCNRSTTNNNCTSGMTTVNGDQVIYAYGGIQTMYGSCDGTMVSVWTQLNASFSNICDNFDYVVGQNQIDVPIRIAFPKDTKRGSMQDQVTFRGIGDDATC